MARWQDAFDSHPLHSTLVTARSYLDTKLDKLNSEVVVEKRRLEKILGLIEVCLKGVDPESVSLQQLNTMYETLQQQSFIGYLQAFSTSPEAAYLTSANDQITTILPTILSFARLSGDLATRASMKSLEKTFDNFSSEIDNKSAEFRGVIDESRVELESLAASFVSLKASVQKVEAATDERLSEWQKQFTDDQTTRAEGFSAAQISKEKEFADWLMAAKQSSLKKADSMIASHDITLSKFYKEFEVDIDSLRLDAEQRHLAILSLHGLVAGDSVAAGYLNNADSERDQANFWRLAAIGFILITAIWIGVTYWHDFDATSPLNLIWAKLVKAASLTGVLLFGAVYSSKQSSFHRTNEKQNRRFALEVKAFDPFVASLSKEQQGLLKEKLSERLFGQSDKLDVATVASVDPNVLKIIVDAIKDAVKTN